MNSVVSNNHDNFECNNLEIFNETVESMIKLNECDETIKEVLNIFQEPRIVEKYVFKAPLVIDNKLTYGYKIKLLMISTTNIEYTENSALGQTKFISRDTRFNVTITLPKNYEEGKMINIIPSVIHVSYKIINCRTLYTSAFLSFALTV